MPNLIDVTEWPDNMIDALLDAQAGLHVDMSTFSPKQRLLIARALGVEFKSLKAELDWLHG